MTNLYLLICFIATISGAMAQQDTSLVTMKHEAKGQKPVLKWTSDMEIGFPIGDFHEKIARDVVVGKGIGFYFPVKEKPLYIGLRLGDLTYDKISYYYFDTINGVEEHFVRKTKNKVWLWQCNAHYEPQIHAILRPYLEAGFGLQRLFSKTFARKTGVNLGGEDEALLNERFDKKVLHSEWGGTLSAALGLKINLRQNNDYAYWIVQLGGRYGSQNDFFIKKDQLITHPAPLDNLEMRRSKLTTVYLRIGFAVIFSKTVFGI